MTLTLQENKKIQLLFCTIMYRSITKLPIAPPSKPQVIWLFWKNFGQIPRYVASLDGQMPHPLEHQRGSNSAPSRHVKATVQTLFDVKNHLFKCTYSVINNWLLFGLKFVLTAILMTNYRVICYIKTQLKYPKVSQHYLYTKVLNFWRFRNWLVHKDH